MRLLREVNETERFPGWFWGVAYRRFDTWKVVLAPVPLNRLIGGARRAWFWLKGVARPALWERDQVELRFWKEKYLTLKDRQLREDAAAGRLAAKIAEAAGRGGHAYLNERQGYDEIPSA